MAENVETLKQAPPNHTLILSPPPKPHNFSISLKKTNFIHCVHNGDPLFPSPTPVPRAFPLPAALWSQIPEPGLLRPLREIR